MSLNHKVGDVMAVKIGSTVEPKKEAAKKSASTKGKKTVKEK